MDEKWDELDKAARANLTGWAYIEFFRFKEELKKDGHQWEDDAEDILSGYIWDCLEENE